MSNDNSEGYAVVGFFFGLFMFYKGFRQFRNYLLLADTPEIAIRSIPMGFGEVHGKAQGEKTLQSPISHTPCFVYKVVIQRWNNDSGKDDDGYWVPHQVDWDGVGFHLTDDTGKVLVDAQGAELDIPETASCEAGAGADPNPVLQPPRRNCWNMSPGRNRIGAEACSSTGSGMQASTWAPLTNSGGRI